MVDRRPSDDVELMDVADAVHVAAGIEQRAHDVEVGACAAAQCMRVGVVPGLARVRIRAAFQQASRTASRSPRCAAEWSSVQPR